MKVSLVIPVYNEERYIKKCLESVFKQTEMPDEIIVVDNNSKDKTAEIVNKFQVKFINEKAQGMIHARNRGFNEAKYEIIVRTDADAILSPDWIKTAKKRFKDKSLAGLTGPISFFGLFKKPTSTLPSKIYLESLKALSKGKYCLHGNNMAIRKSVWKDIKDIVNLDDKKVHEDIDLSMKIHKVGGLIEYDEKFSLQVSARRIKENPESFFVEYPIRVARTLLQGPEASS